MMSTTATGRQLLLEAFEAFLRRASQTHLHEHLAENFYRYAKAADGFNVRAQESLFLL